ncbi:InlB B-repeat-containing protein [Brevibacillus sp. SIMBA_040]|uniref:InlB B-repeat-containing protein n=1 Tax=Brevibacillus sp. SIMBA_040 TaxID=3085781 RepID=UPI00397C8E06
MEFSWKFTNGREPSNLNINNITIANVKGVSTITPTTASFDKYVSASNYKDITTTMDLKGNVLSGIKNGSTPLVKGTDYTVLDTIATIKKEFLATLAVGTSDLTFVFDGGTEKTLTITVSDTSPKDSTITPTTASFDKYQSSVKYKDVQTTMTLNGNALSSIKNGSTPLVQGTDYSVSGSLVTIKKEYLATQAVGTTSLVFAFSAGATQTLAITISDTTPQNSTITPTTASFDKYPSAAGYKDIPTTMTLNGNALSSIKNGSTPLVLGTDYSLSGSVVTIKKEYLATQAVGTTSLVFAFSAGATQTLTITVSDTTPPPTYIVTYNGNGATSGTAPIDSGTYEQGDTVTVLGSGSLVKTGHTFAGWNTAANGSGTDYAAGSTLTMGTANVILYAQWTTVQVPTYTVTYNGNGETSGTAPIDNNTYQQGDTVTVLGSGSLAKTGYTFAGWNTAANGSGTSYAAGSTLTMGTANVILYAQWTTVQAPTYTVTYDGNGETSGIAPTDSGAYEQGDTVTVLGSGTLAKTGHTFAGWNTAANGSGTAYAAGSTLTMGTANVILYAQWTPVQAPTYTVTYNGNDETSGTAPTDSGTYEQGDAVTVLGSGSLVKTGHTFAGWNTAANGSGTAYAAGSTLTMGAANVILYAQWTPDQAPTYTVTYNGNGETSGTAPIDNNTYQQGDTVTVQGSGTIAKTGYTFAGWNTMSNGSGTSYAAGSTLTMGTANVILYAQWTTVQAPTFTVMYDGNGETSGTAPTDSGAYEQGDTVTVLGSGTLAKTGHTFAGWNTAANGSGTAYAAGSTLTMGTANVILYAQWSPVQAPTYTVTYNGNDETSGTAPTDSGTYEQGDTVTVLGSGSLVKTGHTFAGWNTAANGSGTSYAAGSTLTMGAANVILYAQWTPVQAPTYTVTYHGNGATSGTAPTDNGTYEQGDSVTVLGSGTLTKTDHTFAGWNTTANGSGTSYAAGSTLPMGTSNITLYAQWTYTPVPVFHEIVSVTQTTEITDIPNGTAKTSPALGLPSQVEASLSNGNTMNLDVSWAVAEASYDPTVKEEQRFTVTGRLVNLPSNVRNSQNHSATIRVTVNAADDETDPKDIVSVQTPEEITGVANGTAKTAKALGLPQLVEAILDDGNSMDIRVDWDVESSDYDPENEEAQTFRVRGQLILPKGITNTKNQRASIQVSVDAADTEGEKRDIVSVTDPNDITGVENGTRKTASALGLPDEVGVTLDNGKSLFVGVNWDLDEADYNPNSTKRQRFIVEGVLTKLPSGVSNSKKLRAEIQVTVAAAPRDRDRDDDEDQGGKGSGGNSGSSSGRSSDSTRSAVVEAGTSNGLREQIKITRKQSSNGKKVDEVVFDTNDAKEILNLADANNKETIRIIIDDLPKDPADEVVVNIMKRALERLQNEVALEIQTPSLIITISKEMLATISTDELYFHIVPVPDKNKQQGAIERAINAKEVKQAAGGKDVQIVGAPMVIEANYQNRTTLILFQWKDSSLPTNPIELQALLASLSVYVEHTDGETELLDGRLKYDQNGNFLGIEIEIDKFSTFTILSLKGKKQQPYITGYPDGTFRPNSQLTRAEVAAILYKLLQAEGKQASALVSYRDVGPELWAADAISLVSSEKLMTGDADGKFQPNAKVSRAEMASIIATWKQLTNSSKTVAFTDTKGLAQEAGIAAVAEKGYMIGFKDGSFRPNQLLTRAEAVTIINRLTGRAPSNETAEQSWSDVPTSYWAFADIMAATGYKN